MQFAYFYFMRDVPDRVRATAPLHGAYWRNLRLLNFKGGPFLDKSGGLIIFEAESEAEVERLVTGDPFVREGLLESRWIKEWTPD